MKRKWSPNQNGIDDETSLKDSELKSSPRKKVCTNSLKQDGSNTQLMKQKSFKDGGHTLSQEEWIKLRQSRKAREKEAMERPKLFLKGVGLKNPVDGKTLLLDMIDLQQLLHIAVDYNGAILKPRWCRVIRFHKMSCIVVIVAEGVSVDDYYENPECFPNIRNFFQLVKDKIVLGEEKSEKDQRGEMKKEEEKEEQEGGKREDDDERETKSATQTWLGGKHNRRENELAIVEMTSPCHYGSSVQKDLFLVPVSEAQLKKYCVSHCLYSKEKKPSTQQSTSASQKFGAWTNLNRGVNNQGKNRIVVSTHKFDEFSRTELLLSAAQMFMYGYPLPVKGLQDAYKSFVYTKDQYAPVTDSSPMLAIDCEMCETKNSRVLTRISVVNENLEVVYTTFVKPDEIITNYLTRYSGITEEKLRNVCTKLSDVQRTLRELITPDTILVGHQMRGDLLALKMIHPYVIDTAVIYNSTHSREFHGRLRYFTFCYLGRKIQIEDDGIGHNPSEDAIATMELCKLKLKNSVDFGDFILQGKGFDRPWRDADLQKHKYKMIKSNNIKIDRTQTYTRGPAKTFFHYFEDTCLYQSFFQMMKETNRTWKVIDKACNMPENIGSCDIENCSKDDKKTHALLKEYLKYNSKLQVEANYKDFCVKRHYFIYAHLYDAAEHLKSHGSGGESFKKKLKTMDKRIGKTLDQVPAKALVVVLFTGRKEDNKIQNALTFAKMK